jgi:hypothetical protein
VHGSEQDTMGSKNMGRPRRPGRPKALGGRRRRSRQHRFEEHIPMICLARQQRGMTYIYLEMVDMAADDAGVCISRLVK